MPRANRYFLPGYVWHITHRCHQRKFLLRFGCDRRRYLHWVFEAKKRYGLCVLDYIVTSNHIHLLVKDKDTGPDVIAPSMQLIAGRTAQQYNQRKGRQGAFWEDRYHATAIEADEHLRHCLAYIDLNMVRAGVISHPGQGCWGTLLTRWTSFPSGMVWPGSGSPIGRQVSRATDVPGRIFLIPFLTLADFVMS